MKGLQHWESILFYLADIKYKFPCSDAAQAWLVVVATLSLADKREQALKVVLDL